MRFILLCLLLMPALLSAAPNVLLIISDDLRDALGCYGHPLAKTPHLDLLAARGVRFENAYVQYPVCNPSRTSLLTGLRCEQTGITGNQTFFRTVLPDVVTLPQLLRQGGWTAHSFGKIFHAANTGEMLRAEWLDEGRSWDKATTGRAVAEKPAGEIRNLTGGKLPWCEIGICDGPDEDQPDAQTATAAIRSMEELSAAGKPWMVAAGFHRPHDPFHAPRRYFEMYPKDKLPLYRDPADITPGRAMTMPGGVETFAKFSDDDRRSFLQAYLAGVSFMDAQAGRLLEALERLKLAENTVVIFLGDHGYHLGERGWWNKNTLFERSCRAPLLIAGPGVKGGQVCRSPVEFVDIYPTVAELCGQKPPHALAGKSLRPLLEDAARPHKDAAFTLVTRGPEKFGQSVRTARWRFTRWSDGTMELYDHQADAQEVRDVSSDAAHAAVIADLKSKLDTLPAWPPLREAESLFFTGENKASASAQLLRVPSALPRITSANGDIEFRAGRDFIWEPGSRTVTLTANSRMPFKTTAELYPPANSPHSYKKQRGTEQWMFFGPHGLMHSLQCVAGYPSKDEWRVPLPPAASQEQPGKLRARLSARQPVKLVVLGDSISTEADASALANALPFQRGYPSLVARRMEAKFGAKVTVKNLSVGGMDSAWGLTQVPAAIAEKPDFFLIAFGMNDASGRRTPEEFARLTKEIAAPVHAALPDCTVLLVTSMTANSGWIHSAPELYPKYATALHALTGPGIACADVTSVWTAVESRKKHMDLSGNGLNHPNDYGHRLYADTIMAVLGDAP